MEDVIDILRERNEPVPVPLDLPDEDLLVEIEEELLISMPDDLRFFLKWKLKKPKRAEP